MKSWTDKWPIEVYKSDKSHEVFVYQDKTYLIKHITLAFVFKISEKERIEDGLNINHFKKRNFRKYLENIEKRLFMRSLMQFHTTFTNDQLPIKGEGEIFTTIDVNFGNDGKPKYVAVEDGDIEEVVKSIPNDHRIVMTDRIPWKFKQYEDFCSYNQHCRYYRRMAFAMMPEKAKILIDKPLEEAV